LLFDTAAQWQMGFRAIRLLSGSYLLQHSIMDAHYGVINRISRMGRDAISKEAEQSLVENFSPELEAGAIVLGGHQLLERNPQYTPATLSRLCDDIGTLKLAGGTYAMKLEDSGRQLIVLNPFHPYQLSDFTGTDKAIFVFEAITEAPWSEIRRSFAGATDPKKAKLGSIRAQFLENRVNLGIASVNQGSNGIHVSAGPIEGMVELHRFFSDPEANEDIPFSATNLGRGLLSSGFDDQEIERLASNIDLNVDNRIVSAFDLTEEMDTESAIDLLAKVAR
jgi:hypothetical protein